MIDSNMVILCKKKFYLCRIFIKKKKNYYYKWIIKKSTKYPIVHPGPMSPWWRPFWFQRHLIWDTILRFTLTCLQNILLRNKLITWKTLKSVDMTFTVDHVHKIGQKLKTFSNSIANNTIVFRTKKMNCYNTFSNRAL